MANEYWESISEYIVSEQQKTAQLIEKRKKELRERERLFETQKSEEELRAKNKKKREERIIHDAQDKLLEIFEEVRSSSPSIRRARLSTAFICDTGGPLDSFGGHNFSMGGVVLAWGEKFGFTLQEKELIEKYEFRPLISFFPPLLPDEILCCDYYCIYTGIRMDLDVDSRANTIAFHYDRGEKHIGTIEFIQTSDIAIPIIANCLMLPIYRKRIYYKGGDYWTTKAKKYPLAYGGSSSVTGYYSPGGDSPNAGT